MLFICASYISASITHHTTAWWCSTAHMWHVAFTSKHSTHCGHYSTTALQHYGVLCSLNLCKSPGVVLSILCLVASLEFLCNFFPLREIFGKKQLSQPSVRYESQTWCNVWCCVLVLVLCLLLLPPFLMTFGMDILNSEQ